MTIETAMARLDITGFGSSTSFVSQQFRNAYNGSAGLAAAVESWLSNNPSRNILIENYLQDDNAFGGDGKVFIGLNFASTLAYIDINGNAVLYTFMGVLVHELGHALRGWVDTDATPSFTYGTNVLNVNLWLSELGIRQNLSYIAQDIIGDTLQDILTPGFSYTNGERVYGAITGDYLTSVDVRAQGGGASVLLLGSSSANIYSGTDGRDHIYGNGGNDVLNGYIGDDRIFGGEGDDEINGGVGADQLDGGVGNDKFIADLDDTMIAGGVGNDTVDYSNSDRAINWATARTAVSSVETVIGSNFNDTFILTVNALLPDEETRIFGGAGDDIITGNDSNDKLFGQEGDDRIDGGTDDDILDGGAGNDNICGRSGDDIILGGAGDDRIEGNEGEDNIVAGDGNDIVEGGDGNDSINGGDGQDALWGQAGDDLIAGGAGADTIRGHEGNDRLLGGEGNDTLYGGEGDDLLAGDDGSDSLNGDEGVDTIDAGAGNDVVRGGDGNDTIIGGAGDDTLIGEGGSDTLIGGAGDDVIDARSSDSTFGRDSLYGGSGSDFFITDFGDTIYDLQRGDRGVSVAGVRLSGGERDGPPADPCNPPPPPPRGQGEDGTYKSSDGTIYSLSGTTLTVTVNDGIFVDSTITILNFRNGAGGITLRTNRPNTEQAECQRDPLIIDLNSDRRVVTELSQSYAYFDLDNDGFREHVGWSTPSDGFLVRDLNGNGQIDNGSELFGTGRVERDGINLARVGTEGFSELGVLDGNNDGLISALDAGFSTLRVWVDANGDALTDAGELKTLAELGLVSISLRTRASDDLDPGRDGSNASFMSSVTQTNGSVIGIYDVYLTIDQFDSREIVTDVVVSDAITALPFLIGSGSLSDLDVAIARDPALEEMVRAFSQLGVADVSEIADRVEQILFRWTGADVIGEDSRGININARSLHVLERLTGSSFNQNRVGPNPRADAATILIEEYQELLDQVTAKLLGQTVLGQTLLPGLSFEAGAFFVAVEGQTLSQILTVAASHAPTGHQDAIRYWATIVSVIDVYAADGAIVATELPTLLDPILAANDVILSTAQLRDSIVGTNATELVANDAISAFFPSRNALDLIIAGDGPAILRGASASSIYVIGQADDIVEIRSGYRVASGSTGGQGIILTEHRFEDFDIVGTFKNAGGNRLEGELDIRLVSRIDGTIIVIPGRISGSGFDSPIRTITFDGGSEPVTKSLIEIIGEGISITGQNGTVRFGNPLVAGILVGDAGDDVLLGFSERDEYRFGPESGNDIIIERGGGFALSDQLTLSGTRVEYRFEIAGNLQTDLRVTHIGSGATVAVVNQFAQQRFEVELFVFSDGTTLSASDLAQIVSAGTIGDDQIIGTFRDDVIDGLGGRDVVDGRAGADRYIVERGYGTTTIADVDTANVLVFGADIELSDLQFIRSGQDLAIAYGEGDTVYLRRSTSASPSPIDRIEFDDGSSISFADFVQQAIVQTGTAVDGRVFGTPGNDTLTGTAANDIIDGLGGRDFVNGGDGNDTFVFGEGRLTINDGPFTFDTLYIPDSYSINDLILGRNFSQIRLGFLNSEGIALLPNEITNLGNVDSFSADDIDRILFADGRVIDLSVGSVDTGTAGNDILINWRDRSPVGGPVVIRPGAGDDYIFSGNRNQILELSSGFGDDVFVANFRSAVRFTNIAFNANVDFSRVGDDLVVSFGNASDTLLVRNAFNPIGDVSLTSIQFSNSTLSYQQIVNLISVPTPGDDLLFGTVTLDGGAGNDVLIGSSATDGYVFGRGYGNDVIKERDSFSGNSGNNDTLTLTGLNRDDVTFARDPANLLSIVITINDTGETLTLDGTPFDDISYYNEFSNNFGGGYERDFSGAHWIDTIVFANGETISQRDIEQAIYASESSDGNDRILSFGMPWTISGFQAGSLLDGGLGNDQYDNGFRDVRVAFGSNSGSDTLINTAGRQSTVHIVLLEDLDASDVLVLFEQRDGKPVTIIRSTSGSELLIVDDLGDSTRSQVRITNSAGQFFFPTEDGGLVAGTVGTPDVDYLVGLTDGFNDGEGTFAQPVDDVFMPGEGDDIIAGRGGDDIVRFNRGDGADTLLGDQENPQGGIDIVGRASRNGNFGSYTVEFGAGISRSDIDIIWLDGLSDNVRINVVGTSDSITARAATLSELRFADGSVLSFDGPQTVFYVEPFSSAPPLTSNNETIIAVGGRAAVQLESDGGQDLLIDLRFEARVAGDDDLQGWAPDRVFLLGVTSLDDFSFIRDSNNLNNLVVVNNATGAELTIQNHFALTEASAASAWLPVDSTGDGIPDWATLDLDNGGTPDFAALDASGDGTPDWVNPDFDGDGQSDWSRVTSGSIDVDGDGLFDAFANDYDNDGIFEEYIIAKDVDLVLRDTDADGTPDEYSVNGQPFLAAPTSPDGTVNWMALDTNENGISDLAFLDLDGNGWPDWIRPGEAQTIASPWSISYADNLFDASGNYVATRLAPDADGIVYFTFNGFADGSSGLLARDTNGDLVPDEYGRNYDGDLVADPFRAPTVANFALVVDSVNNTETFFYDWIEIADRVVVGPVNPRLPGNTFDIFSLAPVPTTGVDRLTVQAGEAIDSLAGNDLVRSESGNATLRFSRGDGNDVFETNRDFLFNTFNNQLQPSGNVVVFEDISALSALRFSRGGDGLSDLIVTIVDTSETLTIRDQFRLDSLGNDVPNVTDFRLSTGQSYNWADILSRVDGVALTGNTDLSTGSNGGLLDGGAGLDNLRGGVGNDTYRFGRGYDEDSIQDAGGFDTVLFDQDVTTADLFFSRTGQNGADLLVEVIGTERLALTIRGQFASDAARVESFQLADGSTLSWRDVQQFILETVSTGSNDVINGFLSDDRIAASGGNDSITGGRGADAIDGGLGRDVAVFRGSRNEYDITTVDGVTTVRDLIANRDGADTLTNVEDLRFLGNNITVPIIAINSPPIVTNLVRSTSEDGEIVIGRSTLLANATDVDGDALSLFSVTGSANSRAWIDLDGNVRYRPNANFNGDDRVNFVISDGNGGLTTGQIFVSVNAANDAPTLAIALANQTAFEDQAISIAINSNSFVDVDGDPLSLTARLSNGNALPAWLTFTNGVIEGVPPANFNGNIAIVIEATDGISTVSGGFGLTIAAINDAPSIVVPIPDIPVVPGASISIQIPTSTFVDVDGDMLSLQLTQASLGSLPIWLTFDGSVLTGIVPADFTGPIDLILNASDGRALATDAFSLVVATNRAPVVVNPLVNISSVEDAAVELQIPANTFSDSDNNPLAITASLADGAPLPSWLNFDGARFAGTPPLNFDGELTIIVTATDPLGLTASSNFTLDILPVNDRPTSTSIDAGAIDEDGSYTFTAAQLLSTANDVDGDPLTVSNVSLAAAFGTVIDNGNGSWTIQPTPNFVGLITITYSVSDGQLATEGSAIVTTNPVNDVPVAANGSGAGIEDGAIIGSVTATDVDADNSPLSYVVVTGPTHGSVVLNSATGVYTYTPAENFNGTDSFTFSANDGAASSNIATISLSVAAVNDAPRASNIDLGTLAEDTSFTITTAQLLANATDVDGDSLSVSHVVLGPIFGTINDNGNGTWTVTPVANRSGSVVIAYTIEDGTAAITNFATMTITPVNDAPVAMAPLANQSSPEDAPVSFTLPAGAFFDVDDAALTLSATLGDGTALPDWLSFNTETLSFSGIPPINFDGDLSITVTAIDAGNLSASSTFTLDITSVNDAPTAGTLALPATLEDTDTIISNIQLLSGVVDVDGDALSVTGVSASSGTVINTGGGNWAFSPAPNSNAPVTLSVTISDGTTSIVRLVTQPITPVNDAPVVAAPILDRVTAEDALFSYTLPTETFVDVDSGSLTLTTSVLPNWLTFNAATRTFFGTPTNSNVGTINVTVTASDGSFSASDVFALTVTNTNDIPTDLILSASTIAENAANGTVVGTATGIDSDTSDTSSYSLANNADGRFAINASTGVVTVAVGTLLDFEAANSHGITIRVTDAAGATYDELFSIAVTNVNEAPIGLTLVSGGTIAENSINGTIVGQLGGTDPDAGATLSYSLIDNAGGRFAINATNGQISVANGGLLDFETATSHSAAARVTDQGGLTRDLTFTVNLTNVVEGPAFNVINGTSDTNILFGTAGDDIISGLGGRDILFGNAGNDILIGGAGADLLWGGAGQDVFRYLSSADAPRATGLFSAFNREAIFDFNFNNGSDHDIIDLSVIDANVLQAGDQAFNFIGASAFTRTAGQLRFANGVLAGDVNGDGVADFEIGIAFQTPFAGQPLDPTDFLL
jgi:Ca2+-binding RTX toxin-like protein